MRTKITKLEMNRVEVRDRNGDTRTYWAPGTGGYVRDVTHQPGTLGRQVCDGLATMGTTLSWNPANGPLVNLIRAEHRAGLRKGW